MEKLSSWFSSRRLIGPGFLGRRKKSAHVAEKAMKRLPESSAGHDYTFWTSHQTPKTQTAIFLVGPKENCSCEESAEWKLDEQQLEQCVQSLYADKRQENEERIMFCFQTTRSGPKPRRLTSSLSGSSRSLSVERLPVHVRRVWFR